MKWDESDWLGLLLVVMMIVGAVAIVVADRMHCRDRWADSGLKVDAGSVCRVEVRPGVWVPEANVRIGADDDARH